MKRVFAVAKRAWVRGSNEDYYAPLSRATLVASNGPSFVFEAGSAAC